MKKYLTIKNIFSNLEEIIAIIAMIILIISMTAQIIWRYVLNNPLTWTDELARVVFIWISFMGASIGMKKGNHIVIDSIFNLFPEKVKGKLEYLIVFLLLFFLAVIFFYGLLLIKKTLYGSTSALGIPNIIYYSPVSFGSLLMIIHIIRFRALKIFRKRQ